MSSAQVQTGNDGIAGVLGKLAMQDSKGAAIVTLGVVDAIQLSSYGDKGYTRDQATSMINMNMAVPGGGLSTSEVNRRFQLCLKWIGVLKRDMKWPAQRISDYLAYILRQELEGKSFEPSARSRWATPDII